MTYILTQFATIQEVKDGLSMIKVNRAPQAAFAMAVPIYVTVHDGAGNSGVVEHVAGALTMTDHSARVLTNAPEFSWHPGILAVLRSLPMPVRNLLPASRSGHQLCPWSTGSGMNGLPGDLSSPSRFLRAAFFVANAPAIKDADEGLGQVSLPSADLDTTETQFIPLDQTQGVTDLSR